MDETQQTNWYVNVLSLLDRVLYSRRYYSHPFYTQLNNEHSNAVLHLEDFPATKWWTVSLKENRDILQLFNCCTQKMFIEHDEKTYLIWLRKMYPRDFQSMSDESILQQVKYDLNDDIYDLSNSLRWDNYRDSDDYWGYGLSYLYHYFNECKEMEQIMGYRSRNTRVSNTTLLDCITPEFYVYLRDHAGKILESFQQHLLIPEEPGYGNVYDQYKQILKNHDFKFPLNNLSTEEQTIVSRAQHAVEISGLVDLLIYIPHMIEDDEEIIQSINNEAEYQIKQYRRDYEMLNEPNSLKRYFNIKKLRDSYNTRSLD